MNEMNNEQTQNIKNTLQQIIIDEFLPGEDPANLHDDTPLISGRILDSLANLRLVKIIEQRFNVQIEPEEMTEENLDSIERIAELIQSKQ